MIASQVCWLAPFKESQAMSLNYDDSGTYDSSYGNMTKGEMDMYQTKSTISSLSAQPFQPDDPLVTTNDPWCCVGSKTALRGRGSRARPISLPVTARLSRYGIA